MRRALLIAILLCILGIVSAGWTSYLETIRREFPTAGLGGIDKLTGVRFSADDWVILEFDGEIPTTTGTSSPTSPFFLSWSVRKHRIIAFRL